MAAGATLALGACSDGDTEAPDAGAPDDAGGDGDGDGGNDAGRDGGDTRALLTRWATDPFSLGSYSFLPVGATPDDRLALQLRQ